MQTVYAKAAAGGVIHARRQREQIGDLPPVKRKLVDAFRILHIGNLHAFSVDERSRTLYLDGGLYVADFESDIDGNSLADLHDETAGPLLEARLFDLDSVVPVRNGAKIVGSVRVRVCVPDDIGFPIR